MKRVPQKCGGAEFSCEMMQLVPSRPLYSSHGKSSGNFGRSVDVQLDTEQLLTVAVVSSFPRTSSPHARRYLPDARLTQQTTTMTTTLTTTMTATNPKATTETLVGSMEPDNGFGLGRAPDHARPVTVDSTRDRPLSRQQQDGRGGASSAFMAGAPPAGQVTLMVVNTGNRTESMGYLSIWGMQSNRIVGALVLISSIRIPTCDRRV